ncbi:MAG: hypothetical protein ABJF10_07630 [Chthoniobacter sp.]|uniref:hypothetical protein n=1 Tax=Chthoniobacter sp. TaxID=2510640 RepID=UPI0032A9D3F4
MTKRTPFSTAFVTLLFAVALLFSTTSARAQAAIKVFKVGDRVEMNIANDVLNDDLWIKGTVTEVIYTDGRRILSYKVKRDGEYVQQFGNLARVIRPLAEGGEEKNTTPAKPEAPPQARANNNSGANPIAPAAPAAGAQTDCSFEKYPALGSGGTFSEALVKSGLYERFSFEKDTGGLSSPLDVGVTLLSFQPGNTFTNTVTVNPARGAERKFDGAPVNATIYRFHAQYIVCRKFSNATRRTQFDGENVMFKAANGNWACVRNGDQHPTDLK